MLNPFVQLGRLEKALVDLMAVVEPENPVYEKVALLGFEFETLKQSIEALETPDVSVRILRNYLETTRVASFDEFSARREARKKVTHDAG
jgi:hypothetical protein